MESVQTAPEALLDAAVQEKPACLHHWLIDRPSGPASKGVCRKCGEERVFQNYVESSAWGYDISLEHLSGNSRIPAGVDVSVGSEGRRFDEEV